MTESRPDEQTDIHTDKSDFIAHCPTNNKHPIVQTVHPAKEKICQSSRLQTILIKGKKEVFYRQGITKPSCTKKETVNIDIPVTSRNGERKIMQSIS